MRVAVTGASGNVGTAVLRRLRRAEDVTQIIGLSRRPPADRAVAPYDGVTWVSADVGDPSAVDLLAATFAGVDAVVHLAWLIQPSHDEPAMRRTNVDGTAHVVQAALTAGVAHIVVASSVGAYSPGNKTDLVDESWPTGGIHTSAYSRHKAANERLLDQVEREYPQVAVTRLRPGLIFQAEAASEIARYFLGGFLPVGWLHRVRPPILPLPSALTFQAVHADDVAEAYWLALASGAVGAFNVAGEPVLDPTALAAAIGAKRTVGIPLGLLRGAAAATWRLHLQPTDAGWIDLAAQSPLMSIERARSELGWRASTSSLDAVAELIQGMGDGRGFPSPPLEPRSQVAR